MDGRAYYGMDKPKLGWFSPLIAQLHILVSVNTLLFHLDCNNIPCCKAVILKTPSLAANITRLVLAVDDLVPAKNLEWMEMIHLLKSLVEIELNDSEINEATYFWYGQIVDLSLVEVSSAPAQKLANSSYALFAKARTYAVFPSHDSMAFIITKPGFPQ